MAGPIPEEILREILSRVNIVEVIHQHVTLRKVGNGYQGLCPFHTDSKPSFHVNEERQFFHCFGCGVGGNAFHFLMQFQSITFPEAVRTLAGRCGIELPQRRLSPDENRKQAERETLLQSNELAASFFRKILLEPRGKSARLYLEKRGISPETQEIFALGYAAPGWTTLVDFLQEQSISLSKAEKAGLIIPRTGSGYYDRFRGRLIFPIHDESGRIVAFGGRALGEENPKYLNGPDTVLFAKRRHLYGLNVARGSIRRSECAVVVEGYTDLITLHQYGIRNVVATLGTALTTDHLMMLRRFCQNVIHVFDADEAGERATLRALDLCQKVGIRGRVLRLPSAHDPDTFVREVGAEAFQEELRKSIPLMDFIFHRVFEKEDISDIEGKTRALQRLLPYIRKLPDALSGDHYVSKLSDRLKVPERRIRQMLSEDPSSRRTRPRVEQPGTGDPHRAERLLMQAILKEPLLVKCLHEGALEELQDPQMRALGTILAEWADEGEHWTPHSLEASIQDPGLAQVLAQLSVRLDEVEDPDRICDDCLKHIRRKALDRHIQALERDIAQAQHQSDADRIRILRDQKVDLILKKARLRCRLDSQSPSRG